MVQVHCSRGCPAGLVNLCGILPHATHQHVIGDLVHFLLHPCNGSLNTQIRPGRHPHPKLTGPWRDASVGRQELLVQCPCTHHRSIPPYAIRVAETDVLTGFSAPPTLSTTMPPPLLSIAETHAHTHMHARSHTGSLGTVQFSH